MTQNFPFKPTNKSFYQKPSSVLTDDSIYWKKLGSPVLVKEFGAIDYLDFSNVEPYYFAATCSVRVQVYNPVTKLVTKNISRFKETSYGGSFRSDGKLLVAGGEEGVLRMFDIQTKRLLRLFAGHTGAVHRTFFAKDNKTLLSYSDDKSVGVWDVASEKLKMKFSEHNDYVRAGAPSPVTPDIVLSGGYDNLVKLYDCRSSETILTVNHGSPVETALFLPSGGVFISGGGTEVKVWDLFNGGKLLANISQHHKTVTCLRLASNNSRLMSASLDRHVKVYDISTFQTVHTIDFPNAVLSMAISPHDETLVVGMVDGIISIRRREEKAIPSDSAVKKLYKFTPDHVSNVDEEIEQVKLPKELKHDKFMRQFEFPKALSTVLNKYYTSKYPNVTVACLQDLIRIGALHKALKGVGQSSISRLLTFITKNLGIPRFSRTLIDVSNAFLEVYEHKIKEFDVDQQHLFTLFQERIDEEIDVCEKICELEGAIGMLLAGALDDTDQDLDHTIDINPSTLAQKDFVLSLE